MRISTGALALSLLVASVCSADPRVVVVGIDAKTQEALGPFGGSYREHHAQLIEKLNASGARAIAFDIYFPENPERAAETRALAAAADASRAPVTIGVLAEDQPDGTLGLLPNAEVFRGTKVAQGAVLARRELFITQDADGVSARTGALLVGAEAGGFRSLVETTLTQAGIADQARLEALGLIEPVTFGWNGAEVQEPALRPQLGKKKPLTLSYVDVLRRGAHPALQGAIVIVGMTDGVQDVQEDPDPSLPELERVSGVYLHAALAERALRAIAEDDAKRQAGAAPSGTRTDGLSGAVDQARERK